MDSDGSRDYMFHRLSDWYIIIKYNISPDKHILRIKQEKYALKTARYLLP
jgi:hypothetical protein